jgi:glycosyltransferase involved in cell wall biosynthesis
LKRYQLVAYSEFVAQHIAARWGRDDVDVLPPSIVPRRYDEATKERLILSVGRLNSASNPKRHDVLLDAFAGLRAVRPDWRFVIAGGGDEADPAVQGLRARAMSLGVEVVADISDAELTALYERASLYWHTAGFGRPADRPELAEHFGLTTIEAMSAGAVALAYADGGQTELVDESVGAAWMTVDELVARSLDLIEDADRRRRLAEAAVVRAARFSNDRFRADLQRLLALRR